MKKIALVGSGELGRRLAYYSETHGLAEIVGSFDDFEPPGTIKFGMPVLGGLQDIAEQFRRGAFKAVIIAIGYKHLAFRKQIFEKLDSQGVEFATFVHPRATIEKDVSLGKGCVVLTDCTVDMGAVLEDNVFVSSRVFVSHDVRVGSHSYLAPCVQLAGHSQVGQRCFLGIGTIVIDSVRVGDGVVAGAGSVVIGDVPDEVLVAGVPAALKKRLSPQQA